MRELRSQGWLRRHRSHIGVYCDWIRIVLQKCAQHVFPVMQTFGVCTKSVFLAMQNQVLQSHEHNDFGYQ